MSQLQFAKIPTANPIPKMAKNGQKQPQMAKKWAKMVAKNEVGQRVGHMEMPKIYFC